MSGHWVVIKGWVTMDDDDTSPDKPRKVIQIASASELSPVLALCNDGSMWYLNKTSMTWSRLPDVPNE